MNVCARRKASERQNVVCGPYSYRQETRSPGPDVTAEATVEENLQNVEFSQFLKVEIC